MVVAASVALLSGCGGTTHKPASAGPVPWLNRPLPLYVVPSPKLVRYRASAPLCRAAQLRVGQGRMGPAAGTLFDTLVFTNTSTTTCLLRGRPAITAEAPSDGRQALQPRLGPTLDQLVPADLRPGGHVLLEFATSDCGCSCTGGPVVRYRNLVFTLPEGGQVDGGRVLLTEGCFLTMSSFGLPPRYVQPRARPGTPATLHVRIELPATVRAGGTLRYTVALANPSGKPVELSPCPGYTEAFVTQAVVRESFRLNCEVRTIPAHGSVRYEMRLAVPAGASGHAKISWSLNTPLGPFAAAVVQITA
jgi:hypothetical protein